MSLIMASTTPPLDFQHENGEEILTKNKEAIRELNCFAKVPITAL
jgi:hypothetical protein